MHNYSCYCFQSVFMIVVLIHWSMHSCMLDPTRIHDSFQYRPSKNVLSGIQIWILFLIEDGRQGIGSGGFNHWIIRWHIWWGHPNIWEGGFTYISFGFIYYLGIEICWPLVRVVNRLFGVSMATPAHSIKPLLSCVGPWWAYIDITFYVYVC